VIVIQRTAVVLQELPDCEPTKAVLDRVRRKLAQEFPPEGATVIEIAALGFGIADTFDMDNMNALRALTERLGIGRRDEDRPGIALYSERGRRHGLPRVEPI
jgi:hypothetical protein